MIDEPFVTPIALRARWAVKPLEWYDRLEPGETILWGAEGTARPRGVIGVRRRVPSGHVHSWLLTPGHRGARLRLVTRDQIAALAALYAEKVGR